MKEGWKRGRDGGEGMSEGEKEGNREKTEEEKERIREGENKRVKETEIERKLQIHKGTKRKPTMRRPHRPASILAISRHNAEDDDPRIVHRARTPLSKLTKKGSLIKNQ